MDLTFKWNTLRPTGRAVADVESPRGFNPRENQTFLLRALENSSILMLPAINFHKFGISKITSTKIDKKCHVPIFSQPHMLHGAGIFTYICPNNHPVL